MNHDERQAAFEGMVDESIAVAVARMVALGVPEDEAMPIARDLSYQVGQAFGVLTSGELPGADG